MGISIHNINSAEGLSKQPALHLIDVASFLISIINYNDKKKLGSIGVLKSFKNES